MRLRQVIFNHEQKEGEVNIMFVNYAHRGASTYAPENTMTSFRLGIQMGANGIETDIQETKDGKLVLFHDDTIERCSNGKGRIADYTYDELLKLDFGSWKNDRFKGERIVLFEDFAKEFFPLDLTFALELKVANIEKKVHDIIMRYGVAEKVYVSSFSFEYLEKMSKLTPKLKLCWLIFDSISQESIDRLKAIDGDQISPKCALATEEGVLLANRNGLGVRLWGVSDVVCMKKACKLNTEGMTVNFPDELTKYLSTSKN